MVYRTLGNVNPLTCPVLKILLVPTIKAPRLDDPSNVTLSLDHLKGGRQLADKGKVSRSDGA